LFRRYGIAVFFDGCYWHECPEHYPNARGGAVRAKDEAVNAELRTHGWLVKRHYEHEDPREAAAAIVALVRANFDRRGWRPNATVARRQQKPEKGTDE
ncbi:MAG TPA: hypothetical protein VF388_00400, partial [Lacunisphaera sp.]